MPILMPSFLNRAKAWCWKVLKNKKYKKIKTWISFSTISFCFALTIHCIKLPCHCNTVPYMDSCIGLPPSPWKIRKLYFSLGILVWIHWKNSNYTTSIKCQAIIDQKRHLNDDDPLCLLGMGFFRILVQTPILSLLWNNVTNINKIKKHLDLHPRSPD